MEVSPALHGDAPQIRHLIEEESRVGEARRSARVLAESIGFDEADAARVAIIASELAHNLLRHAGGGELLLQPIRSTPRVLLELLAIDRGPGMADVERCLSDGFSSASSAGIGLGAVRRLATEFDIHSIPGRGTVVLARVGSSAPVPFGAIRIPVNGETACGDCWRLSLQHGTLSVLMADGLGHGPAAAEAADAAAAAFAAAPLDEPAHILERAHRRMAGTRGAAVACAQRQLGGRLLYAGVGNICGTLLTPGRRQGLVSHAGILGVQARRQQRFEYEGGPSSLLVMHSDGISARWDLELQPGLAQRHPAVIAATLYRDHARGRDDASIVVSRV